MLIDAMTDAELDANAEEHRRLGKGNERDAEELITYKGKPGA